MSDLQIVNATDLPAEHHLNTYFLDLIASIRTITNKKDSIRQFVWQLMSTIPSQYMTIYLVCDIYKDVSIKGTERNLRGSGKRYIITSPDMKTPADFNDFMRNGDNKEMLINLI